MNLVDVKLITIVALDALAPRIIEDLKSCDIKGYTIAKVEGEGLHGKHFTDWEGRNVRIETLVKSDIAERIIQLISDKYLDKYSVIVFLSDAKVLRANRF